MLNLNSLSIFSKKKKVVAFDVGRVFLGIALSDSGKTLAFPYSVLKWDSRPGVFEEYFRKLLQDEMIESVVIGKPMVFDGFGNANSASNRAVELVLELLKSRFPDLSVHLVDERVSTVEADNRMAESGVPRGRRDAVAAQIILERYLKSIE